MAITVSNTHQSVSLGKKSLIDGLGTFFIFHFIYGIILPIDELIFFKMVIAPPSSHQSVSLGGADVEIAPALCASHGMIFQPGHRFYGRDHDHNIFI